MTTFTAVTTRYGPHSSLDKEEDDSRRMNHGQYRLTSCRNAGSSPASWIHPTQQQQRPFSTVLARPNISSNHTTLLLGLGGVTSTTLQGSPRFHPPNQQETQTTFIRSYTPMTKEEETSEKFRVSSLSEAAREEELRTLNREIARLERLRAINTGDAFTWSGRYKLLARNYGFPFMVYYWGVWAGMLMTSYLAMEYGNVNVMALLHQLDGWTGYNFSGNVRPEYGKIGLALVLNEVLEVVRLPFVIVTVKPLMDQLFPPKY